MSKAIESILGHVPLTEALRATASGVPNPFPDEFFQVSSANRILGDRAKYIRISGERRTAKRAMYGSPARRRSLKDIGDQTIRMLHEYESFPIDMMMLQKLRSFEQYQQDEGMDWVAYQLKEASTRHMNARVIATASVLRYGAIYWDSNGNLLPSSSGADTNFTVDMQVPATHKDQCNGNISASWALVNTDIPTDIANLQQYSQQETGLRLTACLYGVNVAKYIRQNNFCQAFLSRNPGFNDKMVTTNEIPDGLFGIEKWIPVYSSFFVSDNDTTVNEMWDDDLAVFVPNVAQPDKMVWWAMYEGSMPVPRTLDVQRDPMAAIKSAEIVYGMGSYAVAGHNPMGVEVYHFDTMLPGIKNEKAPFMADVAF